MDSDNKRATVMLLHGGSEDRLRQVIAQGLVSKEVQQDIEEAMNEAEDARVYAETMQRQVEKQKALISALEQEIRELQKQGKEDADYYAKAVNAYKREEKRKQENADRKEAFLIAILGAGLFIVANIIGRLLFGMLN